MSATTKKKHVTKEVLEEFPLPQAGQQIVKVTASRGNNLHEVVTSNEEKFLVSMPPKFRKHVWIKRGDFIIIDPIEEGDKVKGEITHILFKEQTKHIQQQGLWPASFSPEVTSVEDKSMVPDDMLPPSDSDDSSTELGDLVVNMNRARITYIPSDDSDDSDSENDDEDVEERESDGGGEDCCEKDNTNVEKDCPPSSHQSGDNKDCLSSSSRSGTEKGSTDTG